jgi:Bacteriophage head to tail connecting protein
VLAQQGLLPPMPQELIDARGEYTLEYDGPMARAMRAEEAAGGMRTVESALNIVNVTQDPSHLDHFDFDVMIPEIGEIQGMPERWKRSVEAVQEIRAGRQQQQEQQQAIQALPGAAAMVKAAPAIQEMQQGRK